jgi:hypothetical protein
MYIWKINQLKSDFINGAVTEKSMLKYLVAYTILLGLSFIPFGESNQFDLLNSLLMIPVSVIGLLYIFSANGGGNGTNFISKYFAIGFVVGVRLFVVVLPLAIVLGIVAAIADPDFIEGTTMWDVLFEVMITVFYFWRVAVHVGETAQSKSELVIA